MQIIDTCALINILNCDIWEIFGQNFSRDVCFQGLVEDECSSVQDRLEKLVDRGEVIKFSGSQITAKEVGDMATLFAIGMGEAECLAIAAKYNFDFISDDKRARNAALKVLPHRAVTGSIGIICTLLDDGNINIEQAKYTLETMRCRGGHIPNFDFEKRLIC